MYLLKNLDGSYSISSATGGDVSVVVVDEIDDGLWEKIAGHEEWYSVVDDKVVLRKGEDEIDREIIRERRREECFKVIDRSSLWYDGLSEEQRKELSEWYQAWLEAPQTGEVPQELEWIK